MPIVYFPLPIERKKRESNWQWAIENRKLKIGSVRDDALANEACGVAGDDLIGIDAVDDDRASADDRAIADLDAGADESIGADPAIFADRNRSADQIERA